MKNDIYEKVVSLAKRRGFFYQSGEIYGGLANTYDFGPLGAEMLRSIRNLWWDFFVTKRDNMVGLDAAAISHQKIWEASGHVAGFADALIDCKSCKLRMRADHLIEEVLDIKVEGLPLSDLDKLIVDNHIVCPRCKNFDWTQVRKFNLLFPVHLGIVEGDQDLAYLRGETAQTIFANFKNVINSTRVSLPFGIAQIGKSFRNEITPGNSIFRTLEFEQGEIEYFFDPEKDNWEELFNFWKSQMFYFANEVLGLGSANLRWREHDEKERSFYSKKTEDLEFNFPFGGFKELWGLAYRTDYDLSQHQKYSHEDLTVFDIDTKKKITPHVIEPAGGINRFLLAILCEAYTEDEKRAYLKIKPSLAPYKAAVFPLLSNKPELTALADDVYKTLQSNIDGKIAWDNRGNIGKRYLYQDEVGTPFCITVDFQSLDDKTVTLRDRDTTKQERIKISELSDFLKEKLK